MVKIKKLPSGHWTARVYDYTDESGKLHYKSITCDTKAEVEYQVGLYKKFKKGVKSNKVTVREAIDKYIQISESLSPTTLHSYERIKMYAFEGIMDKVVDSLDDEDMQRAINIEAKRTREQDGKQISPKTVKNEWGLVASALKTICKATYTIKLPKIQKTLRKLPEPQEIISAFKGTELELPVLLAMWMSLRLSEIRGLTYDSIQGDVLYIDKVKVMVGNEDVLKKYAKTDASIRMIHIPTYIMRLIKKTDAWKQKEGYIVDMTVNKLKHAYSKILDQNSLDISFHDLRHYFASISLNILNLPPKVVQQTGGWADPSVMNRIYSESFSSVQVESDKTRDKYFNGLL